MPTPRKSTKKKQEVFVVLVPPTMIIVQGLVQ
jgi:hypothetical protein